MTTTRPILRYFGGKWRLAPWIVSRLPPHRVYVEPFGGAGSVLLRKPRAYAEVYNDLDGDVVSLFRVARDRGEELARALELTPFARDEYDAAHGQRAADELERARQTVVRSFMGFGADSVAQGYKSGFRANSNQSGSTPARDWTTYPDALRQVVERLRGVIVENREACRVMAQHDGPATLHYVDPPYVHDTRGRASVHGYNHEMSDDDHVALLRFLQTVEGMVAVSGYAHPIYDALLADWEREDVDAHADGARDRVESLWLSPAAAEALRRADGRKGMFD